MNYLLPLTYLPPANAFLLYNHSDNVTLEASENYTKGTFRSRCHILGVNGIIRLSIPLTKGKNEQTPIKEVKIFNHENWQKKHWESIQSAYGRAPFFDHYADCLAPCFIKKYDYLWDWNLELYTKLIVFLYPEKKIFLSSVYEKNYTDGTIDLRNSFSANAENNALNLPEMRRYPQVFEDKHGFVPNLSILDYLFCMGPNFL